jgi:hypothetical protein
MPEQEGINKYIDEILNILITSDNLTKLLYYTSEDAVDQPSLTQKQKESLLYDKIFPHRFIPEISDEATSYLNIGFGRFRQTSNNPEFQVGTIKFFISSHISLWKTYYGLRPICILNEIKKLFEDTKLGMGDLKITDSDEYWISNKFGGYYLYFEVMDFK